MDTRGSLLFLRSKRSHLDFQKPLDLNVSPDATRPCQRGDRVAGAKIAALPSRSADALPGIAGESAIMAGIGNGKRTLAPLASLPRAGGPRQARRRLLSRAGAEEISSP